MSKKAKARVLADNEARAYLNNVRISPQKLQLVARAVKGMSASNAILQLGFLQKKGAEFVKNALQSAVANAENNHGLDIDKLYVSTARVGKGMVMKRFRARARGRGARILKPFSNLEVIVKEQQED
jgi:large subunit ribosomal protein L22